MKILHVVRSNSDKTICSKCGYQFSIEISYPNVFTFSENKWKEPPVNLVNCVDQLAKILEIQEY